MNVNRKKQQKDLKQISANITKLNEQIEELNIENKKLNELIKHEKSKTKSNDNNSSDTKKNQTSNSPKNNDATNTNKNATNSNSKQNTPQSSPKTPNKPTSAKKTVKTPSVRERDNEESEFAENEKVKRTSNIPPIDVWTSAQSATQKIIRYRLPNYSCTFSIINKTKMRVFPKSIEIRNRLIDLLNESKLNFNTYTPADEKMQIGFSDI